MRMEEMASPPFVGRHSPKAPLLGELRPQEVKGGPIAHKRKFMGNTPPPALRGHLPRRGNIQRLGNVGIHTDVQTVQHGGSRAG